MVAAIVGMAVERALVTGDGEGVEVDVVVVVAEDEEFSTLGVMNVDRGVVGDCVVLVGCAVFSLDSWGLSTNITGKKEESDQILSVS